MTKPNALGLFADGLDDEIDLEEAGEHLQEQMDEHVDKIIDEANVEEEQATKPKNFFDMDEEQAAGSAPDREKAAQKLR